MSYKAYFYKKLNITYEEAKEQTIDFLNNEIEYYENDEDKLALFKRQLRMVESGLCKEAVMGRFQYKGFDTRYIKGKGHYINYDFLLKDIISTENEHDNVLFSDIETSNFIDNNLDDINFLIKKSKALHKMKFFWKKNPDGMINFE